MTPYTLKSITFVLIHENPQDAKDMAQETFIKIYQKLHTFRFQCSLTTWIYSICASTCLDALRRQQRLITGELKESDATSTHVPEDALLLDELLEHIVHEIDKNNEKTANVLKRRLFAQESYEKISSAEKSPSPRHVPILHVEEEGSCVPYRNSLSKRR